MNFYSSFATVLKKRLIELQSSFDSLFTNKEALHDFRVSARRLLSYLECFDVYLFNKNFIIDKLKFLIKASNELRDIETLIEGLESFENIDSDIIGIKEYFLKLNVSIRQPLEKTLTLCLPDLIEKIHCYVNNGSYTKNNYQTLTLEEIMQHLVKKQVQGIKKINIKKRKLHKLRIEYKKLRYIIEFYSQSQGSEILLVDNLKALQNKLGFIQDLKQHIKILKTNLINLPDYANLIELLIGIYKKQLSLQTNKALETLCFFRYYKLNTIQEVANARFCRNSSN